MAPLVQRLCSALEAREIRYCHWKSTTALDRSAVGATDLDLLVDRAHTGRFLEILASLEFKQAQSPAASGLPGVRNFYGYDAKLDRLVHVHAHYQLIFGHDASKSYRLPIEAPFLDSATKRGPFLVPAPEYELLLFVVRMVLKHSIWAAIFTRQGCFSAAEEHEYEDLVERTEPQKIMEILQTQLPFLPASVFNSCRATLEQRLSPWRRISIARSLQACLASHARRPRWRDMLLVLRGRFQGILRRILGTPLRKRLASGGALIALVGGDGAGKTTALDALEDWLSPVFAVRRMHFGKPRWSWTTRAVRGGLKVLRTIGLESWESPSARYAQPDESGWVPSYSLMLREVCNARDRYLTYRRARRLATNGCLVLADRYPLSRLQQMDGPFVSPLVPESRRNRFVRWLVTQETGYYEHILWPDHLFVLQLDPAIALQRKSDHDVAALRSRAEEILKSDWRTTPARVIDASRPAPEVIAELKSHLWSML